MIDLVSDTDPGQMPVCELVDEDECMHPVAFAVGEPLPKSRKQNAGRSFPRFHQLDTVRHVGDHSYIQIDPLPNEFVGHGPQRMSHVSNEGLLENSLRRDRKRTRLNSSYLVISYAV